MKNWLIHLPRSYKRFVLILTDFLLILFCLFIAFYVRLGWSIPGIFNTYLPIFVATPLSVLFFFYKLDLYKSITRHAGIEVIFLLLRGVSFGVLLVLLVFFLVPIHPPLPRTVLVQFWFYAVFAIVFSRLIASSWLHSASITALLSGFTGLKQSRKRKGRPVAIYGAGSAGRQLAATLLQGDRFFPAAFIDDGDDLQGQIVSGIKVYTPEELSMLVEADEITDVLLALPSISRFRRQEIIRFLEPLDLHVRSVPSMEELAHGLVSVEDVREIDIADILGREPIPGNQMLMRSCIEGKTILITGAGGSIGSELCRQVLKLHPAAMILLDHSEFNLYTIYSELVDLADRRGISPIINPLLGSVSDRTLINKSIRDKVPDLVFHAAAYKHVPLVEDNFCQGFLNNVIGTLELAKAVILHNVPKMVLISTDKAVRPTNIMGSTKRLAELILQGLDSEVVVDFSGLESLISYSAMEQPCGNSSRFTMVRFGNVLDSSGSVVPKFRDQIRRGGPVTVTHRNVSRYFMTIREAAELVLQAVSCSKGGDVFLLDMGEPVKIDDLAKRLIHLSGLTLRDEFNPEGDIEISYTGVRPGEKLVEELLIDDNAVKTEHPKIWRANERVIPWAELKPLLVRVHEAVNTEDLDTLKVLLAAPEIGYQVENNVRHRWAV